MKKTEEYAKAFLAAKDTKEETAVINELWKDTMGEVVRLAKEANRKGVGSDAAVFAINDAMHAKWQKVALLTKRFHPSTFAFLVKENMPDIYPEWAMYRAKIGKPIDLSYFAQKKAELAKLGSS